ncbi:MAG TPA: class I SAM-dependent methyltransferase, partial [Candidatus Peribacteria bacterium]|nr:class I SAM-dependent methyltransferase [Candidatus Peribacteria bacterium]
MIIVAWIVLALVIAFTSILLITIGANAWWHMPYVPTPVSVAGKMADMAGCKTGDVVYDLGCGDGRVLMEAKRKYPGIKAIGYEIALGVWMLAKWRQFWKRSDVTIKLESFMKKNLADADVIFLYLSPSFMTTLLKKFATDLRPGTRIVSHS